MTKKSDPVLDLLSKIDAKLDAQDERLSKLEGRTTGAEPEPIAEPEQSSSAPAPASSKRKKIAMLTHPLCSKRTLLLEPPSPANNGDGVWVTFDHGVEREVDDELAELCASQPLNEMQPHTLAGRRAFTPVFSIWNDRQSFEVEMEEQRRRDEELRIAQERAAARERAASAMKRGSARRVHNAEEN